MFWKEYREEAVGLDDLLNYAEAVRQNPGVIRLKDGAFLRAFYFQGPDLDYAMPEDMERLSRLSADAARQFCDGWMIHVHHFKEEIRHYLPEGAFPDATSWLIDEERRRAFQGEGHFSSVYALALTWKPSAPAHRLNALLYTGKARKELSEEALLESFLKTTGEFHQRLGPLLRLETMNLEEVLRYLHTCVTGLDHVIAGHRPQQEDLDTIVGDQQTVLGMYPTIGRYHVRPVSIDGFPGFTQPDAQKFLHEYTGRYNWSTRAIFLSAKKAKWIIGQKQRNWKQKEKSTGQILAQAGHGENTGNIELHAFSMEVDAQEALAEVESGDVGYVLYTMTILVMEEDEAVADQHAREIVQRIHNHGYGARIEDENAPEAIMGSWPGHGYENVRAAPVHSLNLAHLLPFTSIWAGQPTMPNNYFPPDSPALMLTATSGATPFYSTPWVGQNGMQLILGPIRSGKSTLINMQIAQFFRYPHAQVFAFEKGYSGYPLCLAMGGAHYDLGADDAVTFMPLAGITQEQEREWALTWLEECLLLQQTPMNAEERKEVWEALTRLSEMPYPKTLTALRGTIQSQRLRDALAYYCYGGPMGTMLDAEVDSLRETRCALFEMGNLLDRGTRGFVPVLLHVSHQIDLRLDGRPTLVTFDEARLLMEQTRFAERINQVVRDWPKKNAAAIFATQSLADIEKCEQRDILVESCQTKIFLPNPAAETKQSVALYHDMGLNDRKAEIIRYMTPQREYLSDSPVGTRVFNMHLSRGALSFVGATGLEDIRRVRELVKVHGEVWPAQLLLQRGCGEEAAWWLHKYKQLKGEKPHEKTYFALPPDGSRDVASAAVE